MRDFIEINDEMSDAEYNEAQQLNRKFAYRNETDPLFFDYQKGEITKEDWLAAIQEVKERYPYREPMENFP